MFGSFVKTTREGQGLGLRKFCARHGHDASNWSKIERGVLPPPRDEKTLHKWANQLGLKEGSAEWKSFFDLAHKEQEGNPAEQRLLKEGKAALLVSPPPTTRPEKLPLGDPNFSWSQFEAFARDLVSQLDGVVECNHYGKQGSKQKGIDLIAKYADGKNRAFQCKQVRRFTVRDFKNAVAMTSYKASRFIILLGCEAGSEVRDVVAKKANWEIWDVRDISQRVRALSPEKARSLVERHFGQEWRKLFLGLAPLSPFVSPEKYFEQYMKPDRLFSHRWDLVGRHDTLDALEGFTHTHERVAILCGRGGIGKSKVLESFASGEGRSNAEPVIWFVQEEMPLTAEAFGELPLRPTLLIVDDAHRRDDLKLLLAHAKSRSDVKLLFSARPQGLDVLQSLLSRSGFDRTEVRVLPELKQLDRVSLTALAEQALGPGHAHLADQLAAATRDCPLVTVVGGRLLAQKALNPALLERDEEFRFAVLNRFRDEMLGRIGQENSPLYRALLELISATAPFYSDDKEYLDLAAAYLKENLDVSKETPPERLVNAIGELEKVGLLLRRGRSLRIAPDVLGDHILASLCIAPNGIPTGAAEKLFDRFVDHSPERVLRNLAELDWRIEQFSGKRIDMLAKIWRKIEQDFLAVDSHQRQRLLAVVSEAAYFQPGQALRFVQMAHDVLRKSSAPKAPEIFPLSNDDLIAGLPSILRHVAFNLSYLQECCEMLWLLGRSDFRPLNPFPDHAIRVLQSLAEYNPNKPLVFNQVVLDCLDGWLQEPGAFDFAHSPLSIIDEFLEKSGDVSRSEAGMLVVSPFLISPKATRRIRSRVIEILRRTARNAKPKVIISILETLRGGLHDRFRMGAKPDSPEYLTLWLPEKLEALEAIQEIAAESTNALVHWKVIQVLEWPSRESPLPEVRAKAQEISSGVPDSFQLRLTRALASEMLLPNRVRPNPKDSKFQEQIDAQEKLNNDFRAAVCAEVAHSLSEEQVFPILDLSLREMDAAGFSSWPNHLLWMIGKDYPNLAVQLAYAILASPDTPLHKFFHVLLGGIGSALPGRMEELLGKADAVGTPQVQRSLAQYFWFTNRDSKPEGPALEILRRLIRSEDPHASKLAVESLGFLAKKHPDLALQLALEVPIAGQQARAEAVCQSIEKTFGINPDLLTEEQVASVIGQLDNVPDLEDHWIQQFLSYAATRLPLTVVELFIRRIEHRAETEDSDHRPIPFHVAVDFKSVAKHPDYLQVLRRIRDLTAKPSWQFAYFASDLFWSVAHGAAALDVLREWIQSNEKEQVVGAAHILEKAGNNFVFGYPEFVSEALEQAAAIDEECYRGVFSFLHSSVTSGSKSGPLGGPMPRDLKVRDKSSFLVQRFQGQPKVRAFYESLLKSAESSIRRDREEFEERFGND